MSSSNQPLGFQFGYWLMEMFQKLCKFIWKISKALGTYTTKKIEQKRGRAFHSHWRNEIITAFSILSLIVILIIWALFWKLFAG
jgi:hypothetical protein